MAGWRNIKTGSIHAHGLMGGVQANVTACGRVVLWESGGGGVREGYEFFSGDEPPPGDKRCSHCVLAVKARADWLYDWLGV